MIPQRDISSLISRDAFVRGNGLAGVWLDVLMIPGLGALL